ncbi:MAG: hypothetical protein KJ630_04830 [Proteobacteria bacterium]|nr:hypothetical protein [Pseudomonadota bacterium]
MKIVFHIPRMNWYRVLSPLIEEAARVGHDVECWHHVGATTLGENRPNRPKVPDFRTGVPKIIEYEKAEEIIQLVNVRCPSVIIDIYPPRYPELQKNKETPGRCFFWLLVDIPPGSGICEIQNDEELYGCDAFVIISEYFLKTSIAYGLQNKQELLSNLKKDEFEIGTWPVQWVAGRYMYQFSESQAKYLKERSIVVGNPSFDQYSEIDRDTVRKRFGISKEQRIVVLLPFPFGNDQTAPWEQMFVRSSLFKRLVWVVKKSRFEYLRRAFHLPSNLDFLRALRKFSDKNNAILIGKLRHSTKPQKELVKYCHFLIGYDGYYPHTAAELFSIADLVVGHFSLGCLESIALGTPYLNVEISQFPKKFHCDTVASLLFCDPWPGVVWSMSVLEVVEGLHKKTLESFQLNLDSSQEYLEKFTFWPLGGASSKIIEYLQEKVVSEPNFHF